MDHQTTILNTIDQGVTDKAKELGIDYNKTQCDGKTFLVFLALIDHQDDLCVSNIRVWKHEKQAAVMAREGHFFITTEINGQPWLFDRQGHTSMAALGIKEGQTYQGPIDPELLSNSLTSENEFYTVDLTDTKNPEGELGHRLAVIPLMEGSSTIKTKILRYMLEHQSHLEDKG